MFWSRGAGAEDKVTAKRETQDDVVQLVPTMNLDLLRLLHDVTLAASAADSNEALLRAVVERLCAYTGWPVGHAWRLDGTTRDLIPLDVWQLTDPSRCSAFVAATMGTRGRPGLSLAGRVVSEQRPLWWSELQERPEFLRREAARASGLHTGFAFPLRGANDIVAVLECFTHEGMEAEEPFLEAMAVIGTQLGQVIERRRAEEMFRSLLESAPDAMVMVGRDGRIVMVNAQTERMFGYSRTELLGQAVDFLVPEEKRGLHTEHRQSFEADPRFRPMGAGLNLYARRRDGSEFPAEISLSPLQMENGLVVTAAIRDISRRKQLERQLSESVWREEQKLGQELHDGLGGELTGLSLLAKSLESKLAAQGSALTSEAAFITAGAKQVLEQVRRIAKGLFPVEVQTNGLTAALADLASATSRLGLLCSFDCPKAVPIHDSIFATHLYRIAQEAINNALRHGQARHVRLALRADSEQIVLEVADDGRGFPPAPGAGGLGLHTMRQRAGLIGGSLEIHGGDGGGTVVRCSVKGVSGDRPRTS